MSVRLESVDASAVAALGSELLALCEATFESFDPAYLLDRLPHLDAPSATLARDAEGRLLGFKLGYRQGPGLFYSWLGGVHPQARRRGIAQRLMAAQHTWARTRGYRVVETRTRTANNAMIIVNLQAGFRIVAFEIDRAGIPVVTQRLNLD